MNEETKALCGKTIDEEGNPIEGVQVTLVTRKKHPFLQGPKTNTQGEFELTLESPLPEQESHVTYVGIGTVVFLPK